MYDTCNLWGSVHIYENYLKFYNDNMNFFDIVCRREKSFTKFNSSVNITLLVTMYNNNTFSKINSITDSSF